MHPSLLLRILTFAVIVLSISACDTNREPVRRWRMVALGMPTKIAPSLAIHNNGYYALKQTHEPLFNLATNGEYTSRLLSGWRRSPDSTHYHLCPKEGILFTQGHPFDSEFLSFFVSQQLPKADISAEISIQDNCVDINAKKGGERILPLLSRMENAPSVPSGDPLFEIGLGDFVAVSVSSRTIILKRKVPLSDGFNEIEMHSFSSRSDLLLKDRSVQDFNRLALEDIPEWVRREYDNYGVTMLKSNNLLIDHPNFAVRQTIYECLDIEAFRRAFLTGRSSFQDIATILPIGIPGAKPGRPAQQCSAAKKHPAGSRVVFANWRTGNDEALQLFFKNFTEATGIGVEIRSVSANDYVKMLFGPRRFFHLSVVALDAVSPDYTAFFGVFKEGPGSILHISLPAIQSAYTELLRSSNEEDQARVAQQLNLILSKEAVILPLYQEIRPFYYPRGLKGISIGENLLEYPEISNIRL